MRTMATSGNGFPRNDSNRSPHRTPWSLSSRTIAAPRVPDFGPGFIRLTSSFTSTPVIIAIHAWAQLVSVGWRTCVGLRYVTAPT